MKFTRARVVKKSILKGRIRGGSSSKLQFEINCFKVVLMLLDHETPSKAPLEGSWSIWPCKAWFIWAHGQSVNNDSLVSLLSPPSKCFHIIMPMYVPSNTSCAALDLPTTLTKQAWPFLHHRSLDPPHARYKTYPSYLMRWLYWLIDVVGGLMK